MVTGKRRSSRFSGEWRTYFLGHLIAPRKERVMPEDVPCSKCIELEHIQQITGKIIGACVSGNQKSLKSVFYRGDILFGKLRPYLRKYALTHFSGVCSTEIWVFNSISKAITLNQFAYYLLQSDWFIAAANSTIGTKMPRADWSQLRYLKVKIPSSVKEQTAIAEVLSDADCLIVSLQKLIAKKKAIKQGAMQELLTGKRRLPGFSGEWKTKKIKEIALILDHCRIPVKESVRQAMEGNIPYCGANGVLGFVNDYTIDDDIILVAEDGGYFEEFATRPIAYRMRGKCWVNNHAHILKAKVGIDQDYLFQALVNKDVTAYISSGTRSKLNKSELLKIEIMLPEQVTAQRAIAQVLSDMDTEIEKLEKKLSEYQKIKQGMMQELLTGRIRLINAEPKQEQQVTIAAKKHN